MNQPKIAHYQLLSRLGQGAMGVVFRARDERLEREVAIKLLHVSLDTAEAADYAARLLQEARSAARLNHPGIITVFDCGEWRGKPYLAMELVQGISLKELLEQRGTLAVRDVIRIAKQMFAALAHAHRHDVVHRDIKPANLMLTKDGRLKITDFGIAQLPASDLTRTGTILGSPRYMSPEQLAGSKLDGRADLYSVGVVLYQALTGKVPFDGETTMNIVFNILHSQPVDPTTLNPDIPAWLVSLILRCLAKKPADRFASADEALLAIQSAGVHSAEPKTAEPAKVTEPELDATQPADAAVERSPLWSWLQHTALTLRWVAQQIWILLGKIARQLWPWLLRVAATIKKWAPIASAQLARGWQLMQPVLSRTLQQAKQQFLALPKKIQWAMVGLGLAAVVWLLWPKPDSEIAAATLTWTSASTQTTSAPVVEPDIQTRDIQIEAEPAQETFYEGQPARRQIELATTPSPQAKPEPRAAPSQAQVSRDESALRAGMRQVGQTINSSVTEAINCFNGKVTCPTPTPELQRRGGG